jgi:hypothetical protein
MAVHNIRQISLQLILQDGELITGGLACDVDKGEPHTNLSKPIQGSS